MTIMEQGNKKYKPLSILALRRFYSKMRKYLPDCPPIERVTIKYADLGMRVLADSRTEAFFINRHKERSEHGSGRWWLKKTKAEIRIGSW